LLRAFPKLRPNFVELRKVLRLLDMGHPANTLIDFNLSALTMRRFDARTTGQRET
jgi:hypothetical protein